MHNTLFVDGRNGIYNDLGRSHDQERQQTVVRSQLRHSTQPKFSSENLGWGRTKPMIVSSDSRSTGNLYATWEREVRSQLSQSARQAKEAGSARRLTFCGPKVSSVTGAKS